MKKKKKQPESAFGKKNRVKSKWTQSSSCPLKYFGTAVKILKRTNILD